MQFASISRILYSLHNELKVKFDLESNIETIEMLLVFKYVVAMQLSLA